MKKTLLLIPLVFGASYSAYAGACPTTDTLAYYLSPSFTGCTVGDFTFTDFSYSSATVDPGSIAVTPATAPGESGLEFSNFWAAAPGFSQDSLIDFTVTCTDGCLIDDVVLEAGGVDATTPGSIADVAETSPALMGTSLSAGAAYGSPTTLMDSDTTFMPVNSLTVNKDIGVLGGETGTMIGHGAQISDVTNLFSTAASTVPEPSLAILCVGLLGLLPLARRRFIR
jgi:hypothetical protein